MTTATFFFICLKTNKSGSAAVMIIREDKDHMKAWVELKYGVTGQGITICRSDSPYLLRVFKRCTLQRAEQFANQSDGVDTIIHLYDDLELKKLTKLLDELIPNTCNDNES